MARGIGLRSRRLRVRVPPSLLLNTEKTMAKEVNEDEFTKEVIQSDVPVIVDFYAPWCAPCKAMMPVVDSVSAEADGFKVVKVNVDDSPNLAKIYNIAKLPTFMVFKDGENMNYKTGGMSANALRSMV